MYLSEWLEKAERNGDEVARRWLFDDIELIILKRNMKYVGSFYCGYALFSPPPFEDASYDNTALAGVDVHGGLTFGERFLSFKGEPVQVYGFDCAHASDDRADSPTKDIEWVADQCIQMATQINALKKGTP